MSDLPLSKLQLLQSDELLQEVSIEPGGEVLVGQGETVDLRIPHTSVSKVHARVYLSDGEAYLEDLGSEAGTFVDGRRVEEPLKLRHEQSILLGQHSVLRPVLLRFSDPAEQILMAMGLKNGHPGAPPEENASTGEEVGEAVDNSARGGETALAAPNPELAERLAERREKRARQLRIAGIGLALLLAGTVVTLAIWGALEALRPSAKVWRSVQVTPPILSPGGDMVLQSPDIHPRDELSVLLYGIPAEEKERSRGRLVVTVPELDKLPSGNQEIPLTVRRQRADVYRRMVDYTVRPKIVSIEPERPEVGDVLRISGSGFAEDRSSVSVQAGEHELELQSVNPNEIRAIIPVVTDRQPVELRLKVKIGDLQVARQEPLLISPRRANPFPYGVEASYDPERAAWLLHHPFGPLFYFKVQPEMEERSVEADDESPVAEEPEEATASLGGLAETVEREVVATPPTEVASGEATADAVAPGRRPDGLPYRVRDISERLERLFEAAKRSSDVRVEVEARSGSHTLVAVGEGLSADFAVVRWPDSELAEVSAPGRDDLSTQILAYWIAGRLNHFLNAFAKGQLQQGTDSPPQYLAVLNGLVQRNRDSGGQGFPEQQEIERLSETDRKVLAEAFLPIPDGVGSLSGLWQAKFENVFVSADEGYEVEVELDFTQRRGRVTGHAEASLERETMSFTLQPAAVSGRIRWGTPARVNLSIDFAKPIGSLTLEGTFENSRLTGTFKSRRGRRAGRWVAERMPAMAMRADG